MKYNGFEQKKEAIFNDQLKLHQEFLKMIDELKLNKSKEMNLYQNIETKKLLQEKNFIEEEKERLKINKTHIDLDVKVKNL